MKVGVEDVIVWETMSKPSKIHMLTSARLPMTACYPYSCENQSLTFSQQCSHTFEATRSGRDILALTDRLA